MIERSEVVKWLGGLTEKQLAEVFHEASPAPSSDSRLVLAVARRIDDDTWETSVIGVSADGVPWADDAPLSQEGSCFRCDSRVISWAKGMICPVCGNKLNGS